MSLEATIHHHILHQTGQQSRNVHSCTNPLFSQLNFKSGGHHSGNKREHYSVTTLRYKLID